MTCKVNEMFDCLYGEIVLTSHTHTYAGSKNMYHIYLFLCSKNSKQFKLCLGIIMNVYRYIKTFITIFILKCWLVSLKKPHRSIYVCLLVHLPYKEKTIHIYLISHLLRKMCDFFIVLNCDTKILTQTETGSKYISLCLVGLHKLSVVCTKETFLRLFTVKSQN